MMGSMGPPQGFMGPPQSLPSTLDSMGMPSIEDLVITDVDDEQRRRLEFFLNQKKQLGELKSEEDFEKMSELEFFLNQKKQLGELKS